VDGEPPDLPEESFSEAAKNFVRGCLNKIPNLRPTYAMLLQHPWLAPLVKPATIVEEDEEEAEAAANGTLPQPTESSDIQTTDEVVFDREVADWAKDILEQRRNGTLGKGAPKPALHAAPLDAVSSPGPTTVDGLNGIQIPQTVA
jgi:mitogen-activated protein kinase kinase